MGRGSAIRRSLFLGCLIMNAGISACDGESPGASGGQPAVTDAVWPTAGWSTAHPEDVGMDPAALQRFVDFTTGGWFTTRGMMVIRRGSITKAGTASKWIVVEIDVHRPVSGRAVERLGRRSVAARRLLFRRGGRPHPRDAHRRHQYRGQRADPAGPAGQVFRFRCRGAGGGGLPVPAGNGAGPVPDRRAWGLAFAGPALLRP